ncbi:methyltransferase family protein [Pseudonocardia humida]|uniref:Isoprenylcysteine carboxylmethyltransferase family protein n=1 Tax=Pseudonocardia humida TaxID=2800819 RepID=A0ABT0ZX36_9PSEU|nr:isoprenylcysteine carboxylmethyltransferase family protein [Pseudonocardia humida]MCO1655281.1 isoprenylcysteine carboxylmethyltransferase family protein [Pseudonocardia humida]
MGETYLDARLAATIALVVHAVGLVLAFGVRTWRHRRATGSTGFRGVSGRPGSLPWWGGVLFVLALLLATAAPVLALTGVLAAPPGLVRVATAALGVLVAVAGLAVTVLAQNAMGASWRIGVDESERTALVEAGPFRRVRNPIFTGMAAVLVGVVLLVPTVVAVLALVCLVVAVQIQVRVIEEPYLARAHGPAYADYRARTGRFLPRLR